MYKKPGFRTQLDSQYTKALQAKRDDLHSLCIVEIMDCEKRGYVNV